MEIFIDKNIMEGNYKIYIIDRDKKAYIKQTEIIFQTMNKTGDQIEPAFVFNWEEGEKFLQALVQALIDSGFRDKAFDKDRELKRIDKHLEDMRKIVFKKLDIQEK